MDAQTNLGYMYDQGLGCGRSVNTAASWYRKATERGNPLGQNNLADMYFKGEGVRQDNARHSAGSRKPSHRDTLARASSWDPCTPRAWEKDPEAAYAWIVSASLGGDQTGREPLPKLEGVLSPQQISTARQRAQHLPSEEGKHLSARAFAQ